MTASESTAGALTLRRAAVAGFVVGCGCMVVELTAVRLLAPHFGDSAYVWTNVIGVILAALALGAACGGWAAERRGAGLAGPLLLAAAACTALAPVLGPVLGPWLLPQDLPLDAAMPALVRGSLVASIVLFGPAVALLGAVSPALVVGAVRSGAAVGRAAGLVSAAGTVGSLVGTYAATHLLVPGIGSRAALWTAAGLLAIAAAVVGRARAGAVAALVPALLALTMHGPMRSARPGQELLAERESKQQFLQVVRTEARDGAASRIELKINEGLDSYHSVAIEGSLLTSAPQRTPSSYYDYHALAALVVGDGRRPEGLRALSVGDAAGTIRRVYAGVHPGARVDGVELDPEVVLLGRQWFGNPDVAGEVVAGLDGRVFVERSRATWHVLHVDAYSHQVYVPAHLASLEFFRAANDRLGPGGVVACNVGGLDAADPVVAAIGRTMALVFRDVAALRIPDSRNLLLLGRRDLAIDPAVFGRWTFGSEGLDAQDAAVWQRVVEVAATSKWTHFEPADAASALRDDRPELDRLLQESYVGRPGDGGLVACAGSGAPEGAEAEAYAAFARGDAEGTLRAVGASRAETPYLRYLAGSAQWALRRLQSAEAEFAAATAASPNESLAQVLAAAREGLAAELAPRRHAAEVASRNGWLAALGTLVLAAVAAGVYRMSRMPLWPSVSVDTAAR